MGPGAAAAESGNHADERGGENQGPTVNITPVRGIRPAADHEVDDGRPRDSCDYRNPKREISLGAKDEGHQEVPRKAEDQGGQADKPW